MARSCVYLEDKNVNIETKVKMALLYDIYRNAVKREMLTEEEKASKHILISLCRIPGLLLYKVWIKKYGNQCPL